MMLIGAGASSVELTLNDLTMEPNGIMLLLKEVLTGFLTVPSMEAIRYHLPSD